MILRQLHKAAKMTLKLICIFLAFAGVIQCTLIEGPTHTAVRYGSDTQMKCTVSNKDQHLVYWQAHRVVDTAFIQIYYSPQGTLVPWVEDIPESTYDLRIDNVNYNTSGIYKCDYLTSDIFTEEAELMTMGDMSCGESVQNHIEGSNVPFVCSVTLTGALNPTLTWYIGDREVRGGKYIEQILLEDLEKLTGENKDAVEKSDIIVFDDNIHGGVSPEIKRLYFTSEEGESEPPAFVPRKVEFYQNITVDHTADGEKFTCRLSFTEGTESNPQPPTYTDSCTITLGVTYGATSIEIKPNPSDWNGPRTDDGVMQMKVGEKFTCSASGNPEPTIIWYKIENGVQISLPVGADLDITDEMFGDNHYNCSAHNTPKGQPRYAYRAVKFHVAGHTAEVGEAKGDGYQVLNNTSLLLAALLASVCILQYHKH